MKPFDWLTNSSEKLEKNSMVNAPTFSITKVYTILALVLTPLGTLLATQLGNAEQFSTGQIVTLTAAVLGFGAIALSADILCRGWVTVATVRAKAETERAKAEADAKARAQLRLAPVLDGVVPLDQPVGVTVAAEGNDPEGRVLAARYEDGAMQYYVQVGETKPRWLDPGEVTFR